MAEQLAGELRDSPTFMRCHEVESSSEAAVDTEREVLERGFHDALSVTGVPRAYHRFGDRAIFGGADKWW